MGENSKRKADEDELDMNSYPIDQDPIQETEALFQREFEQEEDAEVMKDIRAQNGRRKNARL